jgi:hypothetical protein
MNKYLVIGVLVVLMGGVFYLTRNDAAPKAQEDKTLTQSTSEHAPAVNPAAAQANEKVTEIPHPVAQSSSESQSSVTIITVERTQNAVDFNAPGAGTAPQKANAAAAATKAYQEAKQQGK